MKRVLIVSYYWPPSGGAGVQRWVKLSRYFAKQNVQSFVVTVDPEKASYALLDTTLNNDVDPSVKVSHTSTFEPYGIYKTLTGKKQIPFGGFANEEKGKVKFTQLITRFIRGNMFLPDARVGWNKYAFRECCRIIESEKIDAVITTSPPHSTQLVGLKLKRKYNITWLADLRDPWTDIYYYNKLFLTRFSRKRDAKMEKSVLDQADVVVVVSEDIRRNLIAKLENRNSHKFHVIPNGFDKADFENITHQPSRTDFVISYTGTLTNDYRIDAFLKAVQAILPLHPEIKLRITGSFPERIHHAIKDAVGERVEFLPHVPHQKAVIQMCHADLLLLVIPDAIGNRGILTGKLFEYLASKKPILCIGPPGGDAEVIITNCEAGASFEYGDESAIKIFILKKLEEWKRTGTTIGGNEQLISAFSRETQAKKMIEVLSAVKK